MPRAFHFARCSCALPKQISGCPKETCGFWRVCLLVVVIVMATPLIRCDMMLVAGFDPKSQAVHFVIPFHICFQVSLLVSHGKHMAKTCVCVCVFSEWQWIFCTGKNCFIFEVQFCDKESELTKHSHFEWHILA